MVRSHGHLSDTLQSTVPEHCSHPPPPPPARPSHLRATTDRLGRSSVGSFLLSLPLSLLTPARRATASAAAFKIKDGRDSFSSPEWQILALDISLPLSFVLYSHFDLTCSFSNEPQLFLMHGGRQLRVREQDNDCMP